MQDFEKRLVQPLRLGLDWLWPDTKIETRQETAAEHAIVVNKGFPGIKYTPLDPDRKRLVIRIHFPDNYKEDHPDWKQECGCCQFIHAIIFILRSLGLGCLTADAEDNFKEGYFEFWVDINETVYARLPTLIERGLGQQEAMPSNVKAD
ncbi:MAG: hypothetical protein P4L61_02675 [Candidatus Pacebacteria bacterium]|nr:hypothetical protein [Candidatus Paceibacterota bacterium]